MPERSLTLGAILAKCCSSSSRRLSSKVSKDSVMAGPLVGSESHAKYGPQLLCHVPWPLARHNCRRIADCLLHDHIPVPLAEQANHVLGTVHDESKQVADIAAENT